MVPCLCVLIHANWYTSNQLTSQAEPFFRAQTPPAAPFAIPRINARFWLGLYYPIKARPRSPGTYLCTYSPVVQVTPSRTVKQMPPCFCCFNVIAHSLGTSTYISTSCFCQGMDKSHCTDRQRSKTLSLTG